MADFPMQGSKRF